MASGAASVDASAAPGPCVAGAETDGRCHSWTGKVRSVTDGDTIDVDVWGDGSSRALRIRIAGVQAMELTSYDPRRRAGECHAVAATERLERLIRRSNGVVRLAAQNPASMAQRRLVRTVAVKTSKGWRDVGSMLMREGLALWWPGWAEWASNARYSTLMAYAMTAQRGLFDPDGCGVGPSAASPLRLLVNWDADGNDGANPSGEWVTVRNLDPANPVPLAGWQVRDAGHRYAFPPHAVIAPGGTILVNVGHAAEDGTVLTWGQNAPLFTNPTYNVTARGDGAYLVDPLGNVRAAMAFPCRVRCTDRLQGAIALAADPSGRGESITLTNLSGAPVDLDGYVLKAVPDSYHFAPGSIVAAGESMRIRIVGDSADGSALDRRWGRAKPILRDSGDVVRLLTYTDITIACVAWGDRRC